MEYRQLGALPISLSRVGYGTARIRDPLRLPDYNSALEAAWGSDIRYFDTAPGYGFGLSERCVGDFLRRKDRQSYVLSTKIGKILKPVQGCPPDVMPFEISYDYSYDGVMRSFEFSLARLGLSSIDLLLADDIEVSTLGIAEYRRHLPRFLEGGIRALEELKANGNITGFGIGVNDVGVCLDIMHRVKLDCVMLSGKYTLIDRTAGTRLLDICERTSTPLIIGGIFNGGTLLEQNLPDHEQDPIAPYAKLAQGIAQEEKISLESAALQFPLQNASVVSAILGTTSSERLRHIVASMNDPIPDHAWSRFNSVALN